MVWMNGMTPAFLLQVPGFLMVIQDCGHRKKLGKNRRPNSPEYTGEFLDGFHNKINVWAAANRIDKQYPERIKDGPQTMLDKLNNTASGYGIVKFHKEQQKITFESWPIYDEMGTGNFQIQNA